MAHLYDHTMHPSIHSSQPQSANDVLAHEIRAAVAEVWRRVIEWRDSPQWTASEANLHRYQVTEHAFTELAKLSETAPGTDGATIAHVIKPILTEWWPNRTGPEQPIYAAVDRLRDVAHSLDHPRPLDTPDLAP